MVGHPVEKRPSELDEFLELRFSIVQCGSYSSVPLFNLLHKVIAE
jgi:hypothetical protein